MAENQDHHAAKNNPALEQNKEDEPLSHLSKVVIIGFIGGVFWSLIGYLAYYFNFTEMGPSLILQPWAIGDWKYETTGHWIGIIVIGLLSIGVALVYNVFLKNTQKIWPSILFGVVLWLIVFYLLNPIFPKLESVREFRINTIITTICLYILYGVFVGYSISYDAEQMKQV
ncbi:MAG TPA: hypothetical protein GX497_07610 [Bacillus bacterium]|nr:hypothetical protein [Bacillus sp. (in: firmicutes)]